MDCSVICLTEARRVWFRRWVLNAMIVSFWSIKRWSRILRREWNSYLHWLIDECGRSNWRENDDARNVRRLGWEVRRTNQNRNVQSESCFYWLVSLKLHRSLIFGCSPHQNTRVRSHYCHNSIIDKIKQIAVSVSLNWMIIRFLVVEIRTRLSIFPERSSSTQWISDIPTIRW